MNKINVERLGFRKIPDGIMLKMHKERFGIKTKP